MYKIICFLLINLTFSYCYKIKREYSDWNLGWKASEYGINDGELEKDDLKEGACGIIKGDIELNDRIVALPSNIYKKYCGKKIIVINTKKDINITLTVSDECPTCDNKQIDIPAYTWNKLNGKSYYKLGNSEIEEDSPGYIKNIKWKVIN